MNESDQFELNEPALICRWRMAGRHIPMLNRHIRALSQRTVGEGPLGRNLLSWVKQHIEWSLAEDASVDPDGVLMVVVDVDGRAAMSVGAYEPLADRSPEALEARAADARREADATGVAPETLCLLRSGELVIGAPGEGFLCGTMTFVEQLARTRGLAVRFDPELAGVAEPSDEVLLVSDEHGVVAALDEGASEKDRELAAFFSEAYETLRKRAADARA